MADIHGNKFVRGGKGVLHLTSSGKTIVANKPLFDANLTFTETGTMQQAAVRDAGAYASFASTQKIYRTRAHESGTTAYALAVADWYGAPKVLEINVDGWTGNAGEIIRVKARDNVYVARVVVMVRDGQGEMLEMGDAVQPEEGSLWWNYTTQIPLALTPFPTLQAIAFDLPGNRDSFTIS